MAPVRTFRAPGRVNLIGEHTDYNLGFVLPIALDLACFARRRPGPEGRLLLESDGHPAREFPIEGLADPKPSGDWTDYPVGVARELVRAGYVIEPAVIHFRSTVPEGSGLSSSAALEVASALALLNGRAIDQVLLAKLCQRAETDFVGTPCGIMDQYVSVFGRDHAAIRIDCRSLTHDSVALPDGADIVAVNTMVKHELGASEYVRRVEECAAAVEQIRKIYPQVESLRDVTMEVFRAVQPRMERTLANRAEHVIGENERVLEFVDASRRADLKSMGDLFVESHHSLQYRYQVSSPELDFLVNEAISMDGIYGARMTGGGFGGCTVNLMRAGMADRFSQKIACAYEKQFGIAPDVYVCRPAGGAGEILLAA